jgi:hypothetical protein
MGREAQANLMDNAGRVDDNGRLGVVRLDAADEEGTLGRQILHKRGHLQLHLLPASEQC